LGRGNAGLNKGRKGGRGETSSDPVLGKTNPKTGIKEFSGLNSKGGVERGAKISRRVAKSTFGRAKKKADR